MSHACLLADLRHATGIRWEWAWGDKETLGIPGCWQLMPEDPRDDNDFWWWHLENARQWFDSPCEAARSLLRSWDAYRQHNARPPEAEERTP